MGSPFLDYWNTITKAKDKSLDPSQFYQYYPPASSTGKQPLFRAADAEEHHFKMNRNVSTSDF